MYALILIIYIQGAQMIVPQIDRLEISPQREATLAKCKAAGNILVGPLPDETDPARQYAWQDYKCVKLEGM